MNTRSGFINVDVFVTEGESSIGVVLYRDGKPIAAGSFDAPSLRRLKTECLRWLIRRRLDAESRIALISELGDVYKMLESYRRDGPDISHDWPGPASTRRIPEIDGSAT